ncbi:uncharacterized protein LOC110569067 [Aotus nancymaae]|uniref:uncharacterized protein LOC110569067 n=1 Tax=Aotus nancymaae TaxID=37293 RepID=UPI000B50328D|nr:uncharacterized protein LOC110569067 [Aotus nancymaae]
MWGTAGGPSKPRCLPLPYPCEIHPTPHALACLEPSVPRGELGTTAGSSHPQSGSVIPREVIPAPVLARSRLAPLAAAARSRLFRSRSCTLHKEMYSAPSSGSRERVCTLGPREGSSGHSVLSFGANGSGSSSPSQLRAAQRRDPRDALGKSKTGNKALFLGPLFSRKPRTRGSHSAPLSGCALLSDTGQSGRLRELRCSCGKGAEVSGGKAKKPLADRRLLPQSGVISVFRLSHPLLEFSFRPHPYEAAPTPDPDPAVHNADLCSRASRLPGGAPRISPHRDHGKFEYLGKTKGARF